MANKNVNPGDLFSQMVTQWETLSNQMANNLMGSDEFGKAQGAAMAASLKVRETMHQQMSRFLEVANMPSREDLTELREAIAKLDGKLDRIEKKIDGASTGSKVKSGPPRTRKPQQKTKSKPKSSTKNG